MVLVLDITLSSAPSSHVALGLRPTLPGPASRRSFSAVMKTRTLLPTPLRIPRPPRSQPWYTLFQRAANAPLDIVAWITRSSGHAMGCGRITRTPALARRTIGHAHSERQAVAHPGMRTGEDGGPHRSRSAPGPGHPRFGGRLQLHSRSRLSFDQGNVGGAWRGPPGDPNRRRTNR